MASYPVTAMPGPVARPVSDGGIARVMPVVLLIWVVFLMPPEARIQIAGLELYSYRLIILPSIFLILYRAVGGAMRLGFADWCIAIATLWSIIAFTYHYGMADGFVSAVAVAVDTAGAYFLVRACIQSETDLRRALIMSVPVIFFSGLLFVSESLSHRVYIRPFFASIFGPVLDYSEGINNVAELFFRQEIRLGLMRAYGTFSHPILGGLMLASLLPLFWLSGIRSWPRYAGALAAFMGFFGISSAAILALVMGVGLLVVDWVLRFVRSISWWMISLAAVVGLVAVQLGTQSGVINLISRVSLNPATAFTRQEIWYYAWLSIEKHPWFGIGRELHERPPGLTASVDAHFLLQGLSTGLITPVAGLAAIFYLLIVLGRMAARAPSWTSRNLLMGVNFTLFIMLFGSMTVTYFSDARVWFMCVIGIAASLHAAGRNAPAPTPGAPR